MAQYSVTLVYSVEAQNRVDARVRLALALRGGGPTGVQHEFESVREVPTLLAERNRESSPWLDAFRDVLLGPKKRTRQRVRGSSRS